MQRIDDDLYWSASDLTGATECEYALLCRLDYLLGWADRVDIPDDPLLEHIAQLGDAHEQRLLEAMQSDGHVAVLDHVARPYNLSGLEAARDATIEAFAGPADVVYQAAFFDG